MSYRKLLISLFLMPALAFGADSDELTKDLYLNCILPVVQDYSVPSNRIRAWFIAFYHEKETYDWRFIYHIDSDLMSVPNPATAFDDESAMQFSYPYSINIEFIILEGRTGLSYIDRISGELVYEVGEEGVASCQPHTKEEMDALIYDYRIEIENYNDIIRSQRLF